MPLWAITGGSGFLGRHLLSILLEEEPTARVVAVGRRCPVGWPAENFLAANLDDLDGLIKSLTELRPDIVLHAAGRTPPAPAQDLFQSNTRNTVHLLSALSAGRRRVRVVLAGSAAELGGAGIPGRPLDETTPCSPCDDYGLSKWYATLAGLAWSEPLEVMVARLFNVMGPGMPPTLAFGRFASALASPGLDPVRLPVGPLDARRDFLDVRDAARAMIAIAQAGHAGRLYHVGTGTSHRVGEGLEQLITLCGRSVILEPAVEASLPKGPRESRSDCRRIAADTGWRPLVSWEQSLADLWDETSRRGSLPLTTEPASV